MTNGGVLDGGVAVALGGGIEARVVFDDGVVHGSVGAGVTETEQSLLPGRPWWRWQRRD